MSGRKLSNKLWVASDTHFGHKNIIHYCNRPYATVRKMDEDMIERWNARVSPDEDVLFLGDFAFASREYIIEVLAALNYRYLLWVPGNHDEKPLAMWEHPVEPVWESHGVKNVEIVAPVHEFRYEGKRFVACHYPMKEWNGKYKGAIHLHGHCHTQHTPTKLQRMVAEKRYDVGVDMYGGPVRITGDLRFLNDAKGWD